MEYYSSKIGNKQVQICMPLLQIWKAISYTHVVMRALGTNHKEAELWQNLDEEHISQMRYSVLIAFIQSLSLCCFL